MTSWAFFSEKNLRGCQCKSLCNVDKEQRNYKVCVVDHHYIAKKNELENYLHVSRLVCTWEAQK